MKLKDYPGQLILEPLCGSAVAIKFESHEFSARLLSVEMQKVTALTNPPEKRKGVDGKSYTPKCLRLVFDKGAFVVVIEDCHIVAVNNGAAFVFPAYQLEVRRAD
jgi:hypothetical protein